MKKSRFGPHRVISVCPAHETEAAHIFYTLNTEFQIENLN